MDYTQFIKPELVPALIFAITTIIGVTNLVKITFPVIKGIWSLLIALVIGGIMGFTNFLGLNLEMGIIAGLASTGIYKVAAKVGGN